MLLASRLQTIRDDTGLTDNNNSKRIGRIRRQDLQQLQIRLELRINPVPDLNSNQRVQPERRNRLQRINLLRRNHHNTRQLLHEPGRNRADDLSGSWVLLRISGRDAWAAAVVALVCALALDSSEPSDRPSRCENLGS